MEYIFIALTVLYLVKLIKQRTLVRNKYENSIVNVLKLTEKIFGKDVEAQISKNIPLVGMPVPLLIYTKGRPDHSTKTETETDIFETWFYGAIPYQYGGETRNKYKTEFRIQNYFVIEIKSN
jgi:hypothetical protein